MANKSDLPPAWDAAESDTLGGKALAVSADTGEGLADLVAAIARRLLGIPHPPEAAVPFRPGHMRSLEAARACLLRSDLDGLVRQLEELLGVAESP